MGGVLQVLCSDLVGAAAGVSGKPARHAFSFPVEAARKPGLHLLESHVRRNVFIKPDEKMTEREATGRKETEERTRGGKKRANLQRRRDEKRKGQGEGGNGPNRAQRAFPSPPALSSPLTRVP